MATKVESIVLQSFDPWPGAELTRTEADSPESPPAEWARLSPASRGLLGGAVVHALGLHPPDSRGDLGAALALVHRILHATVTPGDRLAETDDVKQRMAPYYVADPVERKKWLTLALDLQRLGSPFFAGQVARRLLAAGDVAATLRARRDGLSEQIAKLDRLRGLLVEPSSPRR